MAATVRDIRAGKGFSQPVPEHPEVVGEKRKRKIPFRFAPLPRTFVDWIPHLTANELRVYLAIFSQTMAFDKWSATIPMSELSRLTGLQRTALSTAVKSLAADGKKLIRCTRGFKRVTRYEILTPRLMSADANTNE